MENHKVIAITGATSGIGAELAKQYAEDGFHVALIGRREDKLNEVRSLCQEQGRDALALKADVRNPEDLRHALSQIKDKWGRLDIFVANAGFGVSGLVSKLDIEDYERQFQTNIYGVIRCAQASFDLLKETKGSFVIMGSVMSYVTIPGMSAYAMSKHAVKSLAEALFHEWKPFGVAVTLLCPGYVESEIHKVTNEGDFDAQKRDRRPIKLVVKTEIACRQLKKAIDQKKPVRVVTGHGKFFVWMQRHFQSLSRFLIGKTLGARL